MLGVKAGFFICLSIASFTTTAYGQDVLREHRINALKGLKEVRHWHQSNVRYEVLTTEEIADLVTLGLKQKIPRLSVKEEADSWFVVSYVMSTEGGAVGIRLYRWATLTDTGKKLLTPVWIGERYILGSMTREAFRESLDTVLTRFAADYIRANP